ncbi:MAG: glucose 1-dehydrogenase [Pseudomonadota bacterium]
MVMQRFEDRKVIVTGAGRSIGESIARRFGSEGAFVAVLDLDDKAAERVAAAIRSAGGEALDIDVDLTNTRGLRLALDRARKELGGVDILINNASVVTKNTIQETDGDDWDLELDVTLKAAYLASREILRYMVEAGQGVIINLGSVNAHMALGHPAYSAAKAGVTSLTRSIAVEYGPLGIRCNMVSPGTVRTENDKWRKRLQIDPEIVEKLERWYPVGRIGDAKDVAAAVAFLASDEASFINGADLVVDGGLSAGNMPMMAELTQRGD